MGKGAEGAAHGLIRREGQVESMQSATGDGPGHEGVPAAELCHGREAFGGAGGRRFSTSKMAGSGFWKKAAWRERTASSASSSSIMKLMLISLAPWEIMRTLTCLMAVKTWAAMPHLAADVFADHADEGFLAFVFHVGELAEVVGDGGELVV